MSDNLDRRLKEVLATLPMQSRPKTLADLTTKDFHPGVKIFSFSAKNAFHSSEYLSTFAYAVAGFERLGCWLENDDVLDIAEVYRPKTDDELEQDVRSAQFHWDWAQEQYALMALGENDLVAVESAAERYANDEGLSYPPTANN